jgi:hypothetical protein
MVSTTYCATCFKTGHQTAIHEVLIPNLCLDAHIRVFNKAIRTNNETMEADIINLFGFIFKDNISKRGENYIQNHPNFTFEELEQTFCKKYKIIKNDKEVYMQLCNIQQQIAKRVKVYYECMLKLVNYL